jgi:class 3 adenylate cyclase/tetratricopeptide (TPR) repeat protein
VERRRLATSVFCDLSGSTELGERVDAESVYGLMRSYFDVARAALERHGGSVEKFVGDAVVGMFGVPEAHEDDALRACRAALEIQERIVALNEELVRRHGSGIAVRVGVNTGEVVAGESARRELFASGDAVVLGDSVNVAARLEQAASPGEVLVGEATYRLVHAGVRVEAVPPIVVKGKSEPVIAFRLLEVSKLGPLPRGAGASLVGRAAELALLQREFEAVTVGRRCRLVTVVGEPGVGKSRLASELIASLPPETRAVRGACLSYGEGITYWPVAQIVRELAGISEHDSAEAARERVPARIAHLLGLAEGTTTADQMSVAIVEFLAAAAASEPLVLIVDDIHWAEPALLALLASLPRFIEEAPILLLFLARPELLEARPEWPVTVPLQPLAPADLDLLLNELSAPAAMREQIAKTAAGNPLFAEELVAWVAEGGDLSEMPTSLNALLGARLDRLEPAARDALERGAVEGELFHQGAVVELSDEASRPAIGDELGLLARKDLIRLAAASLVAGGAAYRFKHILVREAAYLATTKKVRASLHERFADWLEQLVGDRVGEYHEILGYHLEQAYRYRTELSPLDDHAHTLAARAAHHLGRAGQFATARGDYHAAVNLLHRALSLGVADERERARLQLELGWVLGETGMRTKARAVLDEAFATATALGDRGLIARARITSLWQGRQGLADWHPKEAQAIAEEAIATFSELGDERGLVEAMRVLAHAVAGQGRREAARVHLERALAHAEAAGVSLTRSRVIESLTEMLVTGPTPVDQGIARCEELRRACGDQPLLAATLDITLAWLYAAARRTDEARECLHRSRAVLDGLSWAAANYLRIRTANTLRLLGDDAAAEQQFHAMWHHFGEAKGGESNHFAHLAAEALANRCCDQGRWEEAEHWHARAAGTSRPGPNARLAAHRGQLEQALTLASEAVERSERTDQVNPRAGAWLTLAEVLRASDRAEEADAAVARAIELYELKGNLAAADRLLAATKY